MSKKLDLENVRIYTKDDILEAIDLIGEKVYFSDDVNFESFKEGNLREVWCANNIVCPFLREYGMGAYKYFILEKDAKFKEGKILRQFKDVNMDSPKALMLDVLKGLTIKGYL